MMMRRANNHMLVAAGAVDAQCRSWETRRRYAFHGLVDPYRNGTLPTRDPPYCLAVPLRR